ncbi:CU044_5270 family protein [Streptomyces sp. FH025]|uniref:CU044_5270 family protein n=1 Tax=Streptomyces sp. FH025 TaxID=2815937 RepID=UPI001A9E5CE6|nr:CU044_5270 family protein [Streptomyces sp. FH025]MBO1416513.1 CU044_5270 family protein [Streptomyces sp. FH025]
MNATPRRDPQHPSEEPERRELTGLLPPPAVPGLGADRQLLLREELLRKAGGAEPRGGLSPRGPHRWRPVRIVLPALACALAIAAVVVVDRAGTVGRDGTTAGGSAIGTPEAAQLLDRIALAAADSEQPTVRADQFVYIESEVAYAAQSAAGGPVTMAPVHTRQAWLSADGGRPGLLREEGAPDSDTPRRDGPSIGAPTHAYVASLPTDPDTLLKLIHDGSRGEGQDPDQRAFTAIGDLLAETWAPPQVSAALYRAAERIPGVTVVRSTSDAAGREGVAVARTAHGQQTQWVFDRTTYAFLGERTVLTEAGDAGPAGTVVGTSAILNKAAVDHAGEVPPPPR